MAINWGILQPVDVGGAFQQGFQQARQQRIEQETDKALAAYAANPNDPQAASSLARYNPRLAIDIQRFQRQDAAAQRKASDDQYKAGVDVIGNAALGISQLPEEQRAQAWDQQIDLLSERFPMLAQFKGQYSPQQLQRVLAESGMTNQSIQNQQPPGLKVVPVGDGQYVLQQGNQINFGQGWVNAGTGGVQAPQTAPVAPQQAVNDGQAAQIIQRATAAREIPQSDLSALAGSLGSNGSAALKGYLEQNRIAIVSPDGRRGWYVNGELYDNPEGR